MNKLTLTSQQLKKMDREGGASLASAGSANILSSFSCTFDLEENWECHRIDNPELARANLTTANFLLLKIVQMLVFDANVINFVSNPSMVPVKFFQKTPLGSPPTPRLGVPKQIIRFHRLPLLRLFSRPPPPPPSFSQNHSIICDTLFTS